MGLDPISETLPRELAGLVFHGCAPGLGIIAWMRILILDGDYEFY